MNDLERRLIELNEALLNMISDHKKPNPDLLKQAQHTLSGGKINTGPGNDVVIINHKEKDCDPGIPGPQGPPGPPGPPGPEGECNCECSAILVSKNYNATKTDYYIGVNGDSPTTITLPTDCDDCQQIIVKVEMGPPLGNRKVTIIPAENQTIDGKDNYILKTPYASVHLICRENNWYIID